MVTAVNASIQLACLCRFPGDRGEHEKERHREEKGGELGGQYSKLEEDITEKSWQIHTFSVVPSDGRPVRHMQTR